MSHGWSMCSTQLVHSQLIQLVNQLDEEDMLTNRYPERQVFHRPSSLHSIIFFLLVFRSYKLTRRPWETYAVTPKNKRRIMLESWYMLRPETHKFKTKWWTVSGLNPATFIFWWDTRNLPSKDESCLVSQGRESLFCPAQWKTRSGRNCHPISS